MYLNRNLILIHLTIPIQIENRFKYDWKYSNWTFFDSNTIEDIEIEIFQIPKIANRICQIKTRKHCFDIRPAKNRISRWPVVKADSRISRRSVIKAAVYPNTIKHCFDIRLAGFRGTVGSPITVDRCMDHEKTVSYNGVLLQQFSLQRS